jgi:hypothetical protein
LLTRKNRRGTGEEQRGTKRKKKKNEQREREQRGTKRNKKE